MRILDRYLLSRFVTALLVGILAFLLIYVLIDFFEKIGSFIDKGTPAETIALLYLYQLPYILVLILPIAMLLATLFTLGRLSRANEISAMLAAGRPLLRILAPILLFSALVSVGSYYFNDRVVIGSNILYEDLRRYEIDREEKRDDAVRRNLRKWTQDGTLLWAEAYYPAQGRFEKPVLLRFDGPRLVDLKTAKHAYWQGHRWRLVDGHHRSLAAEAGRRRQETASYHFESLDLDYVLERPEEFAIKAKKPEAMDYHELSEFIRSQSRSGESADRLLVDLHVKTSFPWANLIIVILGGALSATKRRITMASGFGLTVAVAFGYLFLIRLGLSLGHSLTLPPLVAAWVANLLFLVTGLILLARASR